MCSARLIISDGGKFERRIGIVPAWGIFTRAVYALYEPYSCYNDYMDPLKFLTDHRTLAWLLVPVMFLPIGVTILFLFARIFALLNDSFSAAVLDGTALAFCICWCLSLVLLLVCTVFLLLQRNDCREHFEAE